MYPQSFLSFFFSCLLLGYSKAFGGVSLRYTLGGLYQKQDGRISRSQLALPLIHQSHEEQVEHFLRQKRSSRWVLVADDEEPIRNAVGQLLSGEGYQVTECEDGATVLSLLSTNALGGPHKDNKNLWKVPDCIVSDIRMPGMDGLELLRQIREDDAWVEVPVVLLTAKGMAVDRMEGYRCGADAYLSKPFEPDELVAIVDNVIGRHETLSGANVDVEDLRREVADIKRLLGQGGSGVGKGWVEHTNVFLAPDEREALELLCHGLTTNEIANATFLSSRRIEQLLTRIFRKAGVKNRTELVRWAASTGQVLL